MTLTAAWLAIGGFVLLGVVLGRVLRGGDRRGSAVAPAHRLAQPAANANAATVDRAEVDVDLDIGAGVDVELEPLAAPSLAVPDAGPRAPAMVVEAGSDAAWAEAEAVEFTAAQRSALSTCLAPSFAVLRRAGPCRTVAFRFPPGRLLPWARGEAGGAAPAIAANDGADGSHPLGIAAASALAAAILAGLAETRHLAALSSDAHALRVALDELPAHADAGDERAASLAQDLSRWVRDARGQYASTIGRTAMRGRFAEAHARTVALWRDMHVRVDAARQRLAVAVGAPRRDDLQLEEALRAADVLLDQRALQVFAARLLAAFEMLRVVLGEPAAANAAATPLASAEAALRTGAEDDRALAPRLAALQQGGDIGADTQPADFEVRSDMLHEMLYRLGEVPQAEALDRLQAAAAAVDAGFPLASGADDGWLVQADDALAVVAVRRARHVGVGERASQAAAGRTRESSVR